MYGSPWFLTSHTWVMTLKERVGVHLLSPDTSLDQREGYQNLVLRRLINSDEVEKFGPMPSTGLGYELSNRWGGGSSMSQTTGASGFCWLWDGERGLGESQAVFRISALFAFQSICYSGWFLFFNKPTISFLILPKFTFLNCCHK